MPHERSVETKEVNWLFMAKTGNSNPATAMVAIRIRHKDSSGLRRHNACGVFSLNTQRQKHMDKFKQIISHATISEQDIATYTFPTTKDAEQFPLALADHSFKQQAMELYASNDFAKARLATILCLAFYYNQSDSEVFNPYSNQSVNSRYLDLETITPEEFSLVSRLSKRQDVHPFFACRLLDFCWVCSSKKQERLLDELFVATQKLFQLQGFKTHEFASCIYRALFLLIRTKKRNLVDALVKNTLALIKDTTTTDRFFPVFLSQALRKSKVPYDKKNRNQ